MLPFALVALPISVVGLHFAAGVLFGKSVEMFLFGKRVERVLFGKRVERVLSVELSPIVLAVFPVIVNRLFLLAAAPVALFRLEGIQLRVVAPAGRIDLRHRAIPISLIIVTALPAQPLLLPLLPIPLPETLAFPLRPRGVRHLFLDGLLVDGPALEVVEDSLH